MTNALNPRIAVFHLSVFPQFVRPEHGSVFAQSLTLGRTQLEISFAVNLSIILVAARLAAWFARNPAWIGVQRWFMGLVPGGLARASRRRKGAIDAPSAAVIYCDAKGVP